MLDRFVYGQVSRISPEAPIPVLRLERTETPHSVVPATLCAICTL